MKPLVMLAAAIVFSGCSRPSAPLPDPASIKSMKAQWHSDEVFEVHDHFGQIVEALKPNRADPHPARWMFLGSLDVETADGTTFINLFDLPEREELAFKIDDTYYLGGSRSKLDEAMAPVAPKVERKVAPKVNRK